MLTVDFTTSNANSGTQYIVTDISTDTAGSISKQVTIISGINGNPLEDTGVIDKSINPLVFDATNWGIVDKAMVIVQVAYGGDPIQGSVSFAKGYFLPLSINMQIQ